MIRTFAVLLTVLILKPGDLGVSIAKARFYLTRGQPEKIAQAKPQN
tara:strand:- start:10719 stop:10856 length:138 start_codon:yes stop_codon:yes gene_type:complete